MITGCFIAYVILLGIIETRYRDCRMPNWANVIMFPAWALTVGLAAVYDAVVAVIDTGKGK